MNKITTLTLALLLSAQAAHAGAKAGSCDISIEREVRGYTIPAGHDKHPVIARIDGRFDSTARKWWVDIAVAPTCLVVGACGLWYADAASNFGAGTTWDTKHLDPDSPQRAQEELLRLRRECHDYIRKNFADDIAVDHGKWGVYAEHVFCSEPGINGEPGNEIPSDNWGEGNQYSIWVLRGDIQYGPEKTEEEIQTLQCGKLRDCRMRAKTSAQLKEVVSLNAMLGCF